MKNTLQQARCKVFFLFGGKEFKTIIKQEPKVI